MRRELTPEQKRIFRAYYLDRAKLIVGQAIFIVFGLVMPMMHGLRIIKLPAFIYIAGAGVGLVLILTTRANRQAS